MTTRSSRFWLIGGAVVAVLIVLVSWFLVISPVRADTQQLHDDTEAVETQNDALEAKLNELKEQDEHRDELVTGVRASLAALPPVVAIPTFNRQILNQAASHHIQVSSITVGAAITPTQAGGVPPAPGTPAAGQLTVPIVIQTKGAVLDQLYFLRDIQEVGPRLALVSSTSFNSETDEAGTDANTLTIQLNIFASSLSDGDREQLAEVLGDDLSG